MDINSCSNCEKFGSLLPGMFFFASFMAFCRAFDLVYILPPPFCLERPESCGLRFYIAKFKPINVSK
jgi:hypothetical protein